MKKYLFWFQIAAANGYSGQKYDLLQYSIHVPCQLAKKGIIMGHYELQLCASCMCGGVPYSGNFCTVQNFAFLADRLGATKIRTPKF